MLRDFQKEGFDIIIQAGQSNSDGTGYGDALNPYVPNENVWYMTGDFVIAPAAEAVNGNQIQSNYSLSFADEYMKNGLLKEGRKLLILRTSVGATGFCDKRWGLQDDLFLRLIEMTKTALSLNSGNRLVAFLWHQGETDALENTSYQVHYHNLLTLVNTVRTTFNCPELAFVAGNFVEQWRNENPAICGPVIKAIRDVCADLSASAFVETDGLLSNAQTFECDDNIHFSRQSLYLLGERYFRAFQSLQ